MPSRGPLSIIAVLCLAFFWGYNKDSVLSAWARWQHAAPVRETAPAEAPPAAVPNQPTASTSIFSPLPNPRPEQQPGTVVPPAPPPGAALSNTLDSVRPGQIQPQQITQRNAYFEKLSQQLKELQGGGNPNQPPGTPGPMNGEQPPPPPPPGAVGPGGFAPNGGVPPLPPGYPDAAAAQQPQPGVFDPRTGIEQVTPGVEAADDEPDEADDSDEPDEPEE